MKSRKQIGDHIKIARKSNGWTQKKLAQKVGITSSYISRLETDGVYPSDELAKKLARVLRLNEKEFRKDALEGRTSINIDKELLSSGSSTPLKLDEEEKDILSLFKELPHAARSALRELLKSVRH